MSGFLSKLPDLRTDAGLLAYLREVRKFPMLTPEQEFMLAKRWREHGDIEAAHQLVTSHLRYVAKIALRYRGYGLPLADLIAEGNIGMMQAVKKFDPDRGFRLATYALWWIKASMQEYILRSWSLVKIGTTAAQKRLFFNLRRLKNQIAGYNDGDLPKEQVMAIAKELAVTEDEVISMNRRMGGKDQSLNALIGGEDNTDERQDWLVDQSADQEQQTANAQESAQRQKFLQEAMGALNQREREIIEARRLRDDPATLESLSEIYKISRERVRQIEARAFEKLQQSLKEAVQQTVLASVDDDPRAKKPR